MAEGIILPGLVLVRLQRRYSRECTVKQPCGGGRWPGVLLGSVRLSFKAALCRHTNKHTQCSAFPLIAHKGATLDRKSHNCFGEKMLC